MNLEENLEMPIWYFSNRSLENKDLSSLTNETIKNNYIRPQLKQSSVTIVLIGAETGGRWWVDWEIYCSVSGKLNPTDFGNYFSIITGTRFFFPTFLVIHLDIHFVLGSVRMKPT